MNKYFPKPYEPFSGNINARVYLSNYATKDDIQKYYTYRYLKLWIKNEFS